MEALESLPNFEALKPSYTNKLSAQKFKCCFHYWKSCSLYARTAASQGLSTTSWNLLPGFLHRYHTRAQVLKDWFQWRKDGTEVWVSRFLHQVSNWGMEKPRSVWLCSTVTVLIISLLEYRISMETILSMSVRNYLDWFQWGVKSWILWVEPFSGWEPGIYKWRKGLEK